MKDCSLISDYDNGEGSVDLSERFNSSEAILRADILKDWMFTLEKEYHKALAELRGSTHNRPAYLKKNSPVQYLVNPDTLEYVLYDGTMQNANGKPGSVWLVVNADADGWVPWNVGGRCPLPSGRLCDIRDRDGFEHLNVRALDSPAALAAFWSEEHSTSEGIVSYRPVLSPR